MKSLIVLTVVITSCLVVLCGIALLALDGPDAFQASLMQVLAGAEATITGRTRGARTKKSPSPGLDMIGDESQLSYEVKSSRFALLNVLNNENNLLQRSQIGSTCTIAQRKLSLSLI